MNRKDRYIGKEGKKEGITWKGGKESQREGGRRVTE